MSNQPSVQRQYVGFTVSAMWLIVFFIADMAFIGLVVAPATDRNTVAILAALIVSACVIYVPIQVLLLRFVGGRKKVSDWPV